MHLACLTVYNTACLTVYQVRKDYKAGKKRLQGRQEKTPRRGRKDSEAGKKRLQGRQEKTPR
jgi:hypothetical protein